MTSSEIRQQFIDFFAQRGHAFVPSSPVVPHDDPTLMFTNAGMNQFKPIFLGTVNPGTELARLKRAVNTQKCIRAGGKHNDLDDVGRDTYHHTFFEMLGNWSFGDYFKKEAIEWAWELLTKRWGIDKSRLHATYFGGLKKDGGNSHEATKPRSHEGGAPSPMPQSAIGNSVEWELKPDYEARDLWASVTDIDPSHIHPGNMKDNFWEMGDTGPCGPCSEIHIDLTPDRSGGKLVNAGDARVMEIWNLVFIQFNRGPDGKLTPLPAKHVDTGMGFERLCAVLQGARAGRLGSFSNYDTDVFTPIFAAIQKRTGAPDCTGTLPSDEATKRRSDEVRKDGAVFPQSNGPSVPNQVMIDVAYRVIADHLRCLAFAITDGAMPSNEGRGYVLRRILRRAVRYGRQYFDIHEPFLCDIVEPLVAHMGDTFPELRKAHGGKNVRHVADILRDEEASFLKTLDRGIKLFNEAADFAVARHHSRISGEAAFKLHDTYGFPIDLTEQMAEERGLTVDIREYERLMEEARDRARATTAIHHPAWHEHLQEIGPTQFVGYETTDIDDALLQNVMPVEGSSLTDAMRMKKGQTGFLILSRSPFYAEQGGQVGDLGQLTCDNEGWEFAVNDTLRSGDVIAHMGSCTRGQIVAPNFSTGAFGSTNPSLDQGFHPHVQVCASVDVRRRRPTTQNHTATHILNWALREVLCPPEERENPHVQQKGSLVDPDKTRFDFSHSKALSDEEVARIEGLCNAHIAAGLPVYAASREENFVDQKKAREINTLRAVFGEKYPDRVRVVSIGVPITEEDAKRAGAADWLLRSPKNPKWINYSVEFCGGTHVKNTGEIEKFVLISEEAVAKGIRRVVGVSGDAAKRAEALGQELLNEVVNLSEPRTSVGADSLGPATSESANSRRRTAGIHGASSASESPRGLKSAARLGALAEFQQRFAAAEIPIRVRHQIRTILADLQKAAKEQDKHAAAASSDAVQQEVAELLKNAETVGGVTIVVGEVPAASPDALRGAIDWVRQKTPASAVLLASMADGKVTLLAGMSKSVVERGLKAGDLIKEICPIVGGKGGGRPDLAQGGGTDPSKLPQAIDQGTSWLQVRLTG